MCGIAGIIDLDGKRINPLTLLQMNAAIQHRGRDDEGYVLIDKATGRYALFSGQDSPPEIKRIYPQFVRMNNDFEINIGLAHRRFSILDLSIGGHQPFFSADNSSCSVFNGEIYNYIELRTELLKEGCLFHTNSDTEVLVEAYRIWGTDCFRKFNGFWAVAIYDFRCRRLILSRDRVGKKPLYWTKIGSRVYFASEIKALLQVPEIARSKRPNETAAYLWLAHGWRDLHGYTMFEGIYSLPSASWAIVDGNFPNNNHVFWKVPQERKKENEISVPEAMSSINDILQDAVRIRLRADVPLSVELSGGMDSSALVALAAQLQSQPVSAYTVRFPEKEWNEEPFARSVANQYGVDYKVIESPLDNFWWQILPFTYLQEEPYHSPNLQTAQAIWTMMRAANTKVSLNGSAGDELFAGYPSYFRYAQSENFQAGRVQFFIDNMLHWSEKRWAGGGILSSLKSVALNYAILKIIYAALKGNNINNFIKIQPSDHVLVPRTLSQALFDDMTNSKMPYWVTSDDKTYMGVPFEVRSPFLDYRLVEYVFQLPSSYLIKNGWHKWILRQSLKDLLPNDVLWRRRKMGYPFPYDRFCRDNAPILETIFKKAYNPFLDFCQSDRFRRDWKIISFVLWYELFFNENFPLFQEITDLATRNYCYKDYGYLPEFLVSR